ncbi:C-type lectin protein [Hygrophoropsis aurantiaca]|uniref:C-type lectin protein n=1 Tax=Hygrophoropsis aurantiaca TaxID=72124 RepID=A0ACB8A474_9AGAM|nr:C-type lectin protein [Hygrophoropsis aurantiaca]
MIPQEMLHQKPIDLRHKCLFYIGHIPTFLDMLMSKALKEPHTEPKNFTVIFERGIDPHVDDPDHCHSHSEVPEKDEDWPTLTTILSFRDRVRARLFKLYQDFQSGERTLNRHLARMLVMTLEHEGWHVETLLYMLIQRAGTGTLPPPGFTVPPWEALAAQWNQSIRPPSTPIVTLGPTTVTLGHDDSEGDDFTPGIADNVDGYSFGWDNESPARAVQVGQFRMHWRPISNAEYLAFWKATPGVEMPPSWVQEGEEIKVRTLYGPVSMSTAQHWPVLTSYDGLDSYAKSKGGRLPTEPELRLFFDTYEVGHQGGANVGFRNWHPVPATTGCDELAGRGSNGGVWEWTSTLLSGHEGLVPTKHFAGYSTDFFDEKHHVALGASYATIPRIAGRRTVRNFYQHNYPYPWVGARVVYDV